MVRNHLLFSVQITAPLMWFEFEILPNFPLGNPKTDFKNIYMYIKLMVF